MAKALEPQNNIQTCSLSPTLAKSNSPTQLESQLPPSLPGAKGTQPPPVNYRSKPGILQKPRPLSVPMFFQPQHQPSSPRLPQRPFSPSPDTCPKHTVYPTTVNQKTIAPQKGVQPPPPSSTCEAGIPCTETPLPPPVSPNEGLFRSTTMSSAQGQSSPWWKDRTAQGEEPFKPAPMPKPGRPTIPSKPNLQPSLASRTPPPVTQPKPKQTQVQNSLAHTCSSATHVQELTKDSVDHVGELEQVQESSQPLNDTLSSIIVQCLTLVYMYMLPVSSSNPDREHLLLFSAHPAYMLTLSIIGQCLRVVVLRSVKHLHYDFICRAFSTCLVCSLSHMDVSLSQLHRYIPGLLIGPNPITATWISVTVEVLVSPVNAYPH